MDLLKFKIFEKHENSLEHGLSTRHGGVSEGPFESLNLGLVGDDEKNVAENYRRFCEAAGVDIDKLCVANQEHTDLVLRVDVGAGFKRPFSGIDGFMTNVPGIPLMVRFADCQGILYFDPIKRVVAAVHSGWRGNAKNIVGRTVQKMIHEYGSNPANILVGVSASLGQCHAEFSDPLVELPEFMHRYIGKEGKKVDLWNCCFDELTEKGILPENIEMTCRCTVCENDRFFSFRGGGGKSGHMGAIIALKG